MTQKEIERKTNQHLANLIRDLKRLGSENKSAFWKKIADDLKKPARKKRIVNLSKLDRITKENETIIVPGKVLGTGLLNHKLTIAAWSFSGNALEKIAQANAKAIHIKDLMKESIEGKHIRIIG